MTFHTSARSVGLLPFGISMLAMALTLTPASAEPNSPEVQKKLEKAARAITRSDYGVVVMTSATVEDHMLIINFEPALGTEPAIAVKSMREPNWNQAFCNKTVRAFIGQDGVTIRIKLVPNDQPPIVIFDVTSASCASEATVNSQVSRTIGGIYFAQPPTKDEAQARIQLYIQENFKDPDSAVIKCGEVSEPAWIKPFLEKRRYGYFINCEINGKNSYGGYVGFESYLFRMNGDEFEQVDIHVDKSGLMEQAK